MNIPAIFIRRPIATALLTMGLALAGGLAFFLLPVSPLPNIDIPTISISASIPGASPEVMASSVATPLERHLGAIASVTEMTSTSTEGSTRITLQFAVDRDINGAARDVQAAISAARADLPAALRSNPTYRKINPADFPILVLALTSKTLTPGQIYDAASNIVQQKLSQVNGIGDVSLSGASLPAVRIELNPQALFKYGIGLEDVRAAIAAANANSPKGVIDAGSRKFQLYANDTALDADDYKSLIIAYRNNAAVRLSDVADVYAGVENVRNLGIANGQPAVLVNLTKEPGANVIETADAVKALLPELQKALPPAVDLSVISDSTGAIRNSVFDVELTLLISTLLVILVVFLFLRNLRATLIPSVAVPLSLLGTFGLMYLFGYSLDTLSLMALTISTGFVVDDAIVVLENVTRHVERGVPRLQAAVIGAREVGFTVLSMSVSLIAVFFPILLLGGIVGRLFHEFAMTLAIAIVMSLIVSLTVTPTMCAYLSLPAGEDRENIITRSARRAFEISHRFYGRTLGWALDNPLTIMFILVVTVALNFYLFGKVPASLFPNQDEGRMRGGVVADQSISFQAMEKKFRRFIEIIHDDPAIASFGGYVGSNGYRGGNSGFIFAMLKPVSQRRGSHDNVRTTDQVIERLRPKLEKVSGARLFLQGAQQVRAGGRQSNATYQYTLEGDTLEELNTWVPKITRALQAAPELEDVNSDRDDTGLEIDLSIDRPTAARLGISATQIDDTLYDAFGQRQVSTIYRDTNQYHVVMEVAPKYWQNPETLKDIYVSTSGGAVSGTQATAAVAGTTVIAGRTADSAAAIAQNSARNQAQNSIATTSRGGVSTGTAVSTNAETMVPLAAFAKFDTGGTPIAVNHQGPFVAATISFDLAPGVPLSAAVDVIHRTMEQIHVPISVHGEFAGTAKLFQQSLANEPLLILTAILTVYIVLGMLYESFVHPLTILSTLPSAGVGAVIALLIFKIDFSLIALIGVILLIGIVKKNAIIMIDFAIDLQRRENLPAKEAIYRACLMRFRPIMMTTMAAILGALPLAIGFGEGFELRQPLGVSIVGGLILSQILTLYTTPVVFLYLDRWRAWCKRGWERWYHGMMGDDLPGPAE
jgi:multidrug efflux pump